MVGDGPDLRRLRRAAGPTITFVGRLPDRSVAEILQGARALVVTAVEEFGIAAVESQAAGRPVIARRGGGALETIVDGVTGCFWSGGPEELARAVVAFDDAAVDPRLCARNAAPSFTDTCRDPRLFRQATVGCRSTQRRALSARVRRSPSAPRKSLSRSRTYAPCPRISLCAATFDAYSIIRLRPGRRVH